MVSRLTYAQKDKPDFEHAVSKAIENFPSNRFLVTLSERKLTLGHYQKLLASLFHQVYFSSTTFSLAAAACYGNHAEVRDYLIKHADEEKTHWKWILEDLKNTGYPGPDPRTQFPTESCSAYIAFNVYVASAMPMARLAIASMLEGLGGKLSRNYGEILCESLKLGPSQLNFFFGHSETDSVHSRQISEILSTSNLTGSEWAWMCYAVEVAAGLYYKIYDGTV